MVDLKCKCGKCIHNKNCNCFASKIEVNSGTACKTFTPSSNSKLELADEIAQPLVRPSVDVACSADCVFLRRGKCIANGITVNVNNGNAECNTFLKR